jgi:hypothetical protein
MHALTLLTLATLAQAQDFSWSGELAAGRTLSIRNISGDIRVEPAAGRIATVTARRRAGRYGRADEIEIRREDTDDGVTFCVVYPTQEGEGCRNLRSRGRRGDERWDRNDTRVEFTVHVPAGVVLHAGTVSGDVLARGLRATVEANSVSGDIRLEDVVAPTVEARTVSGDIRLSDVRADEVGAQTVSGNVAFSGEVRPRGQYDLKTLSGDVRMQVPANVSAVVSGVTFSGRISSSFASLERDQESHRRGFGRQRVTATLGEGSARIRLESFSGDVALTER